MDLLEQINANLTTKKVSIVEFAESDEYCGKRLYPRQKLLLKLIFLEELTGQEEDILDYWIAGGRNGSEISISPFIRERREYLIEKGYSHFREVVLSGGRRSSKGFVTGIAMAKKMYDTIQLQDPGGYYQIDPDKEIYFSCIASAEIQAKKFQYADLVASVESCRALESHMGKSLETEFGLMTAADHRKIAAMKARGQRVQRQVARIRGNALASNASTLRGSATMVLCLDEMAHMIPGESRASADQVYEAAEPSLDQFGRDGMIFCNSSPYTKVGKFFERYQESMKLDEEDPSKPAAPLMMGIRFPSWALFDGYQQDPERRFRKAITVSADWDPEEKTEDGKYLWSEVDRAQILIARETERQEPEKYKVERRANFAEVIDAYLNPAAVDLMFMGRPVADGYEPFKTNWSDSTYRHRYIAHLDPSSTTAGFGFALGHLEELTDQHGKTSEHVVFDIIKRWNPRDFPGSVIDWEVVIDEILHYCDLFRPDEVTFDQFQSQAPMQDLRRKLTERNISGVRVYEKVASASSNWNRAEVFRTVLYQHLVHAPNDTDDTELASLELKFLQQQNTGTKWPRVDRQTVGPVQTKDMADCIMTVTETLLGNVVARQTRDDLTDTRMAHGAPGGYQIGGRADQGPLAGYYGKRRGEQKTGSAQGAKPGRRRAWGGKPIHRKLPGW